MLRFKEYLRKAKNLSPADSDAVLKKIDELQGPGGKRGAEPVPTTTPAPAAQPSVAPAAAAPPTATVPPSAAVAATPDPLGISQSAPPEPQESPPVYKRWWFWTGIGAVVAGGAVTGVLLSKKTAPKSPACDTGVACVP